MSAEESSEIAELAPPLPQSSADTTDEALYASDPAYRARVDRCFFSVRGRRNERHVRAIGDVNG
jgi:hypothetical protein